ncbi:MAG: aminodeoxychorismate lyase [Gammaproteobacteria bacterium]
MSAPAGTAPGAGAPSGPEIVVINGETFGPRRGQSGWQLVSLDPLASISVLDRGLHFGDGLFETLACRNGRARFLSLHLERLASGCGRLQIEPGSIDVIRREIESALLNSDAALLKLIVTRGSAVARGYGRTGRETATRVLLRYAWPAEEPTAHRDGVRARVAHMRLGENTALAGMKHLNRLEQVLARSEMSAEDAGELLLFSSSGQLVSGTMSNVFLVQNGRLTTPRLDLCGVAGVMRRVVLLEAEKAGITTEERVLSAEDLAGASEVFLTNARIGIWPVRSLDERSLTVGETTRRLQALIDPMLENPVDA